MKGVKKQSQIKKYLYLFRIGKLIIEEYKLALYYNFLCILESKKFFVKK